MNQIIPLTNAPNQTLTVNLSVNNTALTLTLSINYMEVGQYWVMQISDANGKQLLVDVPLLTGGYPAANVLGQYQYLRIGSAYVLNVAQSTVDYPDSNNLGTDFVLLWGDNV